MKTRVQNLFLVLPCMGLLAMPVTAQTFTNLHSFTGSTNGYYPAGTLILSGNTLYGTTSGNLNDLSSSGSGTVFAINTDGTGFTNLYSFTAVSSGPNHGINSDGAGPVAGLILSGNTLYGTAQYGGTNGSGTVFAINTNGTRFTNLYTFSTVNLESLSLRTNSDGAFPAAGLILSGNTLYGTAAYGGANGQGTAFKVNTDGTDFTNLYSFANGNFSNPQDNMILSGNTLYGATLGTVFAINTDDTGFTNLCNTVSSGGIADPSDLILSGNTLYGRRKKAAVREWAPCLPSTPMARVLRTCIVSLAAATALIR